MRFTQLLPAIPIASAAAFVPLQRSFVTIGTRHLSRSDGDAAIFGDVMDEMSVTMSGSLGHEQDLLKSKAQLDKLMHTKNFRHALDSEDEYEAPASPSPQGFLENEKRSTHFEFSTLKQKKALDNLMKTEEFRHNLDADEDTTPMTHEDDHSIHHFELSLLEEQAALNNVMQNGAFKKGLEDEKTIGAVEAAEIVSLKKNQILDDQMEGKGYPRMRDDDEVTHFEYLALKKRKALDELMQSKGFHHNLDSEDATLDEEIHFTDDPMLHMLESRAALDAVMGEVAFRQSLESDAGTSLGQPSHQLESVPRTHNDITSHFEYATLKKRAALEKLNKAKELRA